MVIILRPLLYTHVFTWTMVYGVIQFNGLLYFSILRSTFFFLSTMQENKQQNYMKQTEEGGSFPLARGEERKGVEENEMLSK
jgi:hypothetical protein